MNDIDIREVVEYDYDYIKNLLEQLVEAIYGDVNKGLGMYEKYYNSITFYKDYKHKMQEGDHLFFVYFCGEIAGFFFLIEYFDREYVYLVDIIIDRKYRGKGVGKEIIAFIENKFKKDIVTEAHPGSLEFFLKNGFEIEKKKTVGRDGVLWYKLIKHV